MKPELQRIAIATACGWKDIRMAEISTPEDGYYAPVGRHDFVSGVPSSYASDGTELPDYLHDLNAMHEAEKTLTKDQCFYYRDEIQKLVLKTTAHCSFDFVFGATAAQRAEAFLKTIGKLDL